MVTHLISAFDSRTFRGLFTCTFYFTNHLPPHIKKSHGKICQITLSWHAPRKKRFVNRYGVNTESVVLSFSIDL